jgi:hypothetical protein|tara:strand:+ start:318 stop:452 length:135 start_codon:yes stop_codon:yes gene_type:complete
MFLRDVSISSTYILISSIKKSESRIESKEVRTDKSDMEGKDKWV